MLLAIAEIDLRTLWNSNERKIFPKSFSATSCLDQRLNPKSY
jgi:hypothetical protein